MGKRGDDWDVIITFIVGIILVVFILYLLEA